MCLYLNILDPCQHSECQIASTIYRSSESYNQNGFTFVRVENSEYAHTLPNRLQRQNTIQSIPNIDIQESPIVPHETIRTLSSKSSVREDKEVNKEMLKIMKKIETEVKELKKNQMVIIMKMEGLENEWRQFRVKEAQ